MKYLTTLEKFIEPLYSGTPCSPRDLLSALSEPFVVLFSFVFRGPSLQPAKKAGPPPATGKPELASHELTAVNQPAGATQVLNPVLRVHKDLE